MWQRQQLTTVTEAVHAQLPCAERATPDTHGQRHGLCLERQPCGRLEARALTARRAGRCFAYELAAAKPDWGDVGKGFIPRKELITDSSALFNAIGILGATVLTCPDAQRPALLLA